MSNSISEICIKLTPKASRNAILGWDEDGEGNKILKVSVTTVPEKGKANKAMISLLSKEWKIPKSNITLIRGETSRLKILKINGLPQEFDSTNI